MDNSKDLVMAGNVFTTSGAVLKTSMGDSLLCLLQCMTSHPNELSTVVPLKLKHINYMIMLKRSRYL